MPFVNRDSLRYYQFDCFNNSEIMHGIFTRRGGVSPSPWASLNLGGTVGDDPENVLENKRIAFTSIGLSMDSIYDVWQVHSSNVVYAIQPRQSGVRHLQADAIITDQTNVTLFMRFADCVPILLYDPIKHVIGIVHAGWQGTVHKIAQAAIQSMVVKFGSNPESILAGVGPSIGPDHYEIRQDVISKVRQAFGKDNAHSLFRSSTVDGVRGENGIKFDLWKANQYLLLETGVRQIEIARLCTACQTDDWFSHRGENGKTGRFGAVISLR